MSHIDTKALFIGPYGENGNEFRHLVLAVLEDIIQWRRNFHPADTRLIAPADKRQESWTNTYDLLLAELDRMLGELKGSAPFHNPRFIGHMHADSSIPSLLGYIAGQLYNQNNVVGESSPITTAKEMAFIQYLCEMVGYTDTEYLPYIKTGYRSKGIVSSGHLTSGGTLANIESMWVALTLKYFPLTLRLWMESESIEDDLTRAIKQYLLPYQKQLRAFGDLTWPDLFNLKPDTIIALSEEVKKLIKTAVIKTPKMNLSVLEASLEKYSVRHLGIHGLHENIYSATGEKLELPLVIVPQSRHYSWEKSIELLGLGSKNMGYLPLDEDFSTSIPAFRVHLETPRAILMVVALMGTTEEGAIDPLDDMIQVSQESGKGFYFHIDAAYGGYYAAAMHGHKDKAWEDYLHNHGLKESFQNLLPKLMALKYADSITIDPHKMGYVPYSAGALLLRDARLKQFILRKAPYLATFTEINYDSARVYMGGHMIEGSRAGAAALACYLTSKVVSNNCWGYGKLVMDTSATTIRLFDLFQKHNQNPQRNFGIKIIPLYRPQTNILCYAVSVPEIIKDPAMMNLLNNKIYERMSVVSLHQQLEHQYYVSKTEFLYRDYQRQLDAFFTQAGLQNWSLEGDFELYVLRSALMNPGTFEVSKDLFEKYIDYLEQLTLELIPEILSEKIFDKYNGERYQIVWIENNPELNKWSRKMMAGSIKNTIDLSRFINFTFELSWHKNILLQAKHWPSAFIIDMNLTGSIQEILLDIQAYYQAHSDKPLIIFYSAQENKNNGLIKAFIKHHLHEYKVVYIDQSLPVNSTIPEELEVLNQIVHGIAAEI